MGIRAGRFMSFLAVFVGLSVFGAGIALSQTLSLDDQSAMATGETVTFTLSIDYPSGDNIQAFTMEVNFDQAVLVPNIVDPSITDPNDPLYKEVAHTRGSLIEDWTTFRVTNPEDGKVSIGGFTFSDLVEPGADGTLVQFQFTVNSEVDTSLTLSVTEPANFTVENGQFTFELPPANNPPMASNDMGTTVQGQSVMIDVLANDEDADGEQLTVTDAGPADYGTVSVAANGATVTYTPNMGFTGSDDFTYTVSDGTDTDMGTVTVTVTAPPPPANNAPVAMDDTAETDEGESVMISVLANDTDADGDTLTVTMATDPSYGDAVVADNGMSITYTPDADFDGEDQFMYTVSDGEGGTDTATVMVDVMEADDGDGMEPGDGMKPDDGDTRRSGGGGGCTLNPGAPFDPTLISVLALLMGVHFVRRFVRRQSVR